jgi:hypothetical protein
MASFAYVETKDFCSIMDTLKTLRCYMTAWETLFASNVKKGPIFRIQSEFYKNNKKKIGNQMKKIGKEYESII